MWTKMRKQKCRSPRCIRPRVSSFSFHYYFFDLMFFSSFCFPHFWVFANLISGFLCARAGSVEILQQYYEKRRPVKFGQCWVFAGTLSTGMLVILILFSFPIE